MGEKGKIGNKTEDRIVASSYILDFHNIVKNLNHFTMQYQNAVIQVGSLYRSVEDQEGMQVNEVQNSAFINILQECRYYVNFSFIKLKTISDNLKAPKEEDKWEKSLKEMEELRDSMNRDFIIESDKLLQYTGMVNNFLLSSVVKDLLETSQSFLEGVYGE